MFFSILVMLLVLGVIGFVWSIKVAFIVYLVGTILSCCFSLLLFKIYPDYYEYQFTQHKQLLQITKMTDGVEENDVDDIIKKSINLGVLLNTILSYSGMYLTFMQLYVYYIGVLPNDLIQNNNNQEEDKENNEDDEKSNNEDNENQM